MMTVLYAVVAFGILIFFHELGHFLVAKMAGVRVLTFALGFGTKLLKVRWGETEYALCAFPLGGYVKMLGEDPDEEVSEKDRARSFDAQPVRTRVIITIAGVGFNLLLAIGIVWMLNWGEVPYLTTRVNGVQEGYPAAEAGIRPGDLIVAIDGHPVRRWEEMFERVMGSDGEPLRIAYERDGSIHLVTVKPKEHFVTSRYGDRIRLWRIGITSGEVAVERNGPMGALLRGCRWTWEKSWFTVRTLIRLVEGKESLKHIGSPLLIGMEASKQAEEGGLGGYFYFIAFISVILAIMNLLPIPVLDGGRLLFLGIEGLLRRPVHRRVYGIAQYVGIALLVCIMAWAVYRDLDRISYMKGSNRGSAPQGETRGSGTATEMP